MAMDCCKNVKEQFNSHKEKLYLDSKHPEKFVQTKCLSQNVYLAWRIIWMVYHCGVIITSGILEQHYASTVANRAKWLVFLTNWTYLVLTLTSIVDVISVLHFRFSAPTFDGEKVTEMTWFLKLLWLLFNISNATGIEISLIYWTAIYDAKWGFSGYRILPFLTHGMNSIYIIMNVIVTGIPVRFLHFWQPMIFGFIYGVFSLIYTVSGGTDDQGNPFIYAILDWNKRPGLTAGVATGAFVAAVLIHFLLFALHRVKVAFERLLCAKSESVVSPCEQ